MKLRCYVCGEPLGAKVVLASHGEDVDRVFVIHPERCADRLTDETIKSEIVTRKRDAVHS